MRKIAVQLFALVFPSFCLSQGDTDTAWVRTNYVKTEAYIPMRDGIKLYTAIYTPRDESEAYPILMQRTPYSCAPYGVNNYRRRLGPNSILMKEKFIFVYQDARGRYKSGGSFREMTPAIEDKKTKLTVDESTDTYDAIEWLIHNTRNNGSVGIYGISFPGFYSSAALPNAHPALKAVSPQAPMSDEFVGDDVYHNGAFYLLDNFGFYSGFDGPRTADSTGYKPFFNARYNDAYQFFLDIGPFANTMKEPYFTDPNSIYRLSAQNDTYTQYWTSRNIRPHLKNIKPAVMIVGGWFDAEDMFGALKTYAAIEKQSPGNDTRLVMGPWTHGGWASSTWKSFGSYQFGSDLNKYYQEEIETKFFDHYLKNKGSFDQSEVKLFETGSNEWRSYDQWPPANSQPEAFYLQAAGKLSTTRPTTGTSATEYISDPAKPVPYTSVISGWRNNEYLVEDQRFAARRPDVISFQTDTLAAAITLTGEIVANLFVSMTGSDADFVVKLIDVWPANSSLPAAAEGQRGTAMGGYQQMVRAEVFRGKFRNSYVNPAAFTPGKVEKVSINLNEVAHTFKPGHRIMVQIQSSWFPLVDRNPQKFGSIPTMKESDYQKETIRVFHDASNSSNIILPVMH